MNQQLTVVLPMYNQEREIRSTVHRILEFSVQAKVNLALVIVDDGSTDETYETACEISCRFPQVQVLRQPFRSGLAAVLDLVRNRLSLDMVILHDGVSPINLVDLQELLLNEWGDVRSIGEVDAQTEANLESLGSRRFGAVRALQKSMERAHRQVIGFSWLKLEKPLVPRRRIQSVDENSAKSRSVTGRLPVPGIILDLPPGYSPHSFKP